MVDHSPFASYTRDKQVIAEALRAVQTYFETRRREIASETMRSLLSHLAEDRFNLVVVGQFKRGKSSLINAILGRDVLPTAIVPLTSIITALRDGPAERALVYREGSGSALSVAVSDLADYVTERGNPNNEKKVSSVDVEVPSPFLRRGLHIVDTPGIASAYHANTATTYGFLPEADAVIFVTSVESPLTEAELSFVDTIRQSVERVFFVLNKVDQVSPAELQEAMAFTEHLLRERLGAPTLRLFPVSARKALDGKLFGERLLIEQSGLTAFEEALASFLRAEREATFLRAILDRARRLLAEEQHLLTLRQSPSQSDGGKQLPRALGEYLDDLTSHRDGVLEGLTARQGDLLVKVVAPALASFMDVEKAGLSQELDAKLAASSGVALEIVYQQMRSWLREILGEHRRIWLTSHAAEWEAVAGDFLREARQALDRHAEDPAAQPELSLSVSRGLPEHPPPFEIGPERSVSSSDELSDGSALFYLPSLFGNRASRRRLHEDLDRELDRTTQEMRSEVDRYLEGVIDRIRRETDRALQDLRRALDSPAPRDDGQPSGLSVETGDPPAADQDVETLIARMAALRDALGTVADGEEAVTAENNLVIVRPAPVEGPADEDVARKSLEAALRGGACPICTVVRKAVWEFLCHWQYVLATDDATRQVFRADGGFCNLHTWSLEAVASPHGLCVGYPPLLDRFGWEVGGLINLPTATIRDRLSTLLPNSERCRLCTFQHRRTEAALRDLAAVLETPDGRKAYLRSSGLCLPHVHALLGIDVTQDIASFLVGEAARHLTTAGEDMRGYALKVDARRRDLITPPEERSSVRVPALLTGDRESLRRPE